MHSSLPEHAPSPLATLIANFLNSMTKTPPAPDEEIPPHVQDQLREAAAAAAAGGTGHSHHGHGHGHAGCGHTHN